MVKKNYNNWKIIQRTEITNYRKIEKCQETYTPLTQSVIPDVESGMCKYISLTCYNALAEWDKLSKQISR